MLRSDVELNSKDALTELRGLLSGRTEQFGQFLIQKSKEWGFTVNELLGAFEQLNEEFSTKGKANKEVFRRVRKYLLNPVSAKNAPTEKTLTPEDANKLASIIAKYIDLDIVGEMTGKEFTLQLFDKMDLDEIIVIEKLLLGDSLPKVLPSKIMTLCVKAMIHNNLLELLKTYKASGE